MSDDYLLDDSRLVMPHDAKTIKLVRKDYHEAQLAARDAVIEQKDKSIRAWKFLEDRIANNGATIEIYNTSFGDAKRTWTAEIDGYLYGYGETPEDAVLEALRAADPDNELLKGSE